ncbi:MAG: prepilin peptidase, partial [Gallionellales bacterium CG08_land_8_20_14_0_20_59_87]
MSDLMLTLLQYSPAFFISLAGILGLLVGSFLNVVIYRLPKMMEREWQAQCAELNEKPLAENAPFNLLVPRSACPQCRHPISALENIPLLS